MKYEYSVSTLRNELYIYKLKTDDLFFSLQGVEMDINFIEMSKEDIENFIDSYCEDLINDGMRLN